MGALFVVLAGGVSTRRPMTRIPYDQAAKRLLDGALEGAGRVAVQHELASEPQWIDVWFEPDEAGCQPGCSGG